MKRLAVVLTTVVVLPSASASKKEPNFDSILRVNGRFSIAHACPIASDLALTSSHVVDPRPLDPDGSLLRLRFQSVSGDTSGWLVPLVAGLDVDVAVLDTTVPVKFYPRAAAAPQVGDMLYFLTYDYRKPAVAFGPRAYSAKVVNVVAGMIVIDAEATPGASGGCVLNDADEVVGLVTGRIGLDNDDTVTVLDGVWGNWIDRLLVRALEVRARAKAAEAQK